MQSDKNPTPIKANRRSSSIFRLIISVILTAPMLVNGASAGQLHPLSDIAGSAETFLRDTGARQFGDNLSVEIQAPDPRLRLALCDAQLKVFSAPGARAFGNTSVGVKCEGSVPWTLYLRARVRVWQDVLVSRGALSRGETLSEHDVMVQKMDISQVGGRFLHSTSQVVDLELRRSLSPGVIVTQSMLQAPQIIQRGDRVTLVARAGNLSVRVAGKALSAGAAGDHITVENIASQRKVQGVIMASGVVRTDHSALQTAITAQAAHQDNDQLATHTKGLPASADNQGVF
ncbi:MAG: flagellar basal body P-ring formation chaperone FlgA [Lysobacterales bacterium]